MRLALDSNVVLALWLFADPALAPLRAACEEGRVTLLSNLACLDELARVLRYPVFKLDEAGADAFHAAYRARLSLVPGPVAPAFALPRCRDKDDQKFLELARDGGADMLLSRDKALLSLARKKLLADRFAILTPEQFLLKYPAL